MIVKVINEATELTEKPQISGFSKFGTNDKYLYDVPDFPDGSTPLINHITDNDNLGIDVIVSGSGDKDFPYFVGLLVGTDDEPAIEGSTCTADFESAAKKAQDLVKTSQKVAKDKSATVDSFRKVMKSNGLDIF